MGSVPPLLAWRPPGPAPPWQSLELYALQSGPGPAELPLHAVPRSHLQAAPPTAERHVSLEAQTLWGDPSCLGRSVATSRRMTAARTASRRDAQATLPNGLMLTFDTLVSPFTQAG